MQIFFHGWRRKAGVVSLVFACGLTSLWFWAEQQNDYAILGI
ncbi:MAG TPA: hypothetical protein VGM98_20495 [Schlesneria sp.]|jgi:hypothetical protein